MVYFGFFVLLFSLAGVDFGGALAAFLAFPLSRPPAGFDAFFTGP